MVNSVIKYLQASVERFPDKIAFSDKEKSLTFFDLDVKARALACEISKKINKATKQPIAVYLPKGVECIVSFLAIAYSGNFYTSLDTSLPEERLKKIISTLEPVLIITNSDKEVVIKSVSPDAVLLTENTNNIIDDVLLENILRSVIDTDVLYVLFTSGSTGEPKGVVISHRAVIDFNNWAINTIDIDRNTVFGNQVPFHFDVSMPDIYLPLFCGASTHIIPEELFLFPVKLIKHINDNKINTLNWVSSAMMILCNKEVLEKIPMPNFKMAIFSAEVLPIKHLNQWIKYYPNATFINMYGPTEITFICTYYIVDRIFNDGDSLPIGYPCANTDILILNDDNKLVNIDEVGELCVRGSCLAHGYYVNDEKTRDSFVQNPLNDKYPEKIYRTGDLVKYNQRGEILYIGRKDSQIKHQGYRIELGEIERACLSFKMVLSCTALYDDVKKRICIAVSPEGINKKELFRHLEVSLPKYMLPHFIETIENMPLNQNGKIDRNKLMELFIK